MTYSKIVSERTVPAYDTSWCIGSRQLCNICPRALPPHPNVLFVPCAHTVSYNSRTRELFLIKKLKLAPVRSDRPKDKRKPNNNSNNNTRHTCWHAKQTYTNDDSKNFGSIVCNTIYDGRPGTSGVDRRAHWQSYRADRLLQRPCRVNARGNLVFDV